MALGLQQWGHRSGWAGWDHILEESREGWSWAGEEGSHLRPQKPEHQGLTVELSILTFHGNVFFLVFDSQWLELSSGKVPHFVARELCLRRRT